MYKNPKNYPSPLLHAAGTVPQLYLITCRFISSGISSTFHSEIFAAPNCLVLPLLVDTYKLFHSRQHELLESKQKKGNEESGLTGYLQAKPQAWAPFTRQPLPTVYA